MKNTSVFASYDVEFVPSRLAIILKKLFEIKIIPMSTCSCDCKYLDGEPCYRQFHTEEMVERRLNMQELEPGRLFSQMICNLQVYSKYYEKTNYQAGYEQNIVP